MTVVGDAAATAAALAELDSVAAITPARMVVLIDQAIAQCINSRGAISAYTIAGRSITASLATLRELRQHYVELQRRDEAGGDIYPTDAAFARGFGG